MARTRAQSKQPVTSSEQPGRLRNMSEPRQRQVEWAAEEAPLSLAEGLDDEQSRDTWPSPPPPEDEGEIDVVLERA